MESNLPGVHLNPQETTYLHQTLMIKVLPQQKHDAEFVEHIENGIELH